MIITELSYQEIASEAENLEGGSNQAFNLAGFFSDTSLQSSLTTAGPNGSSSSSTGATQQIGSIGIAYMGLGLVP